jgi:hypothetical protein
MFDEGGGFGSPPNWPGWDLPPAAPSPLSAALAGMATPALGGTALGGFPLTQVAGEQLFGVMPTQPQATADYIEGLVNQSRQRQDSPPTPGELAAAQYDRVNQRAPFSGMLQGTGEASPMRGAMLLRNMQSEGMSSPAMRQALLGYGGYDTSQYSPLADGEVQRMRAAEQARVSGMLTPGGMMGRFGQGGPFSLANVQAQQMQGFDQPLLQQSTVENVLQGSRPADPLDPFQRRSQSFGFQDPRQVSERNPLGVVGTNQLGMLRILAAQDPQNQQVQTALAGAEAERQDSIRRRAEQAPAVRQQLQQRKQNKANQRELLAFRRAVRQGMGVDQLMALYPNATSQYMSNLSAGSGQKKSDAPSSPLTPQFLDPKAPQTAQIVEERQIAMGNLAGPNGSPFFTAAANSFGQDWQELSNDAREAATTEYLDRVLRGEGEVKELTDEDLSAIHTFSVLAGGQLRSPEFMSLSAADTPEKRRAWLNEYKKKLPAKEERRKSVQGSAQSTFFMNAPMGR